MNRNIIGPKGPRGPPGVVDDRLYVKKEEYDKLKDKVTELERMVEALWDAPGMPGAKRKMEEWDKRATITSVTWTRGQELYP